MEYMCDLETMSSKKDAAIVAIGVVRWKRGAAVPEGGKDTFYRVVNLASAQRSGGRIEASTVMWWLGKGEAARKALLEGEPAVIETALKEFSAWMREESVEGFWGNGSDFDNVILESAYARLGHTPPWTYQVNRCYRTIAGENQQVPRGKYGVAHNALHDAITQARHLQQIWDAQ